MYEVVGYARSEFKPEDKNEPIRGWNIYVQCEDPKVTGYITSIPSLVATVTSLFAYCPTFLLVFLEISLAMMVLFAIFKLL